ncbi:MAG: septal ring lytic transglycosylase RlpA family protein [Deltaproteobacteria bacterium]|nr:septal ring lytic transglycosylase RlpA family protein [Deltaproteobacteria bacterium]
MLRRLIVVTTLALVVPTLEVACATTTKTPTKPRAKKRAPVVAAPDQPADVEEGAAGGDVVGEGMASFYADSLAGRRTANGEKYDPEARTCAHRTLPFGTVVVVEVVGSGRAVTCRINDRGPFAGGRIIDVSKRVARELGIIEQGVAKVRLRSASG